MKKTLPMIKPLVFACSVALAACSSGGRWRMATDRQPLQE